MAYISKNGDKWRAQIERNGVRKSKSFRTKGEAILWAQAAEGEIIEGKAGKLPRKTFADAIDKYLTDVTPKKKGERHETLRLQAIVRDFPALAEKQLSEVRTVDLVEWRDTRLKKVSPGSVQRTVNTLNHLFRVAWKEWHWCEGNPLEGMKSPGDNPPRTRLIKWQETRRICEWLGYKPGGKPVTKMQEVALAFLVSLRTAMRAGEVLQLGADCLDLEKRVATVNHKTQHITGKPRQIPLTRQAVRLLRPVMADRIFSISSASLDAMFRKAKANTQIVDLHFHDARADALTRFARKVDVMTLARISGHRDLKILLDHYYRESAQDIAKRLG